MSAFFKMLGTALWTRVILSYRTTLLGLALAAVDVIIAQLDAAPIPPWAHALVGLCAMALALYRGKAKLPGLPEADRPAPAVAPASGSDAAKLATR